MGWRDRDYARTAGDFHLRGRVVAWLIGITVAAYVLQGLALGRGGMDLARILGVVPSRFIGSGWIWQAVTHPFLHDPGGISHLVFNMLFLYWLGTDIAEIYGVRRFLALYFGGALLCALTYAAAGYATGSTGSAAIGASGAIMAVSVVASFHFPTRVILVMFILPAPLWLVTAGYIALDLYYPLAGLKSWMGSAGHLGGALFGLLWWLGSTRRWPRFRLPRRAGPPMPPRDQVDRILDKITREGIGSLTQAERDALKRASEQ